MNHDILRLIKDSAVVKAASALMAIALLSYPGALFAGEHMLLGATGGFWGTYPLVEGLLICIMLAVFPRISMAYLTFVTGTFGITLLGIIGWILVPHILVACIATTLYWGTDPILVVIAWFIAFSGEIVEKTYIRRRF